jgi:hypothetical protein
MNKYLIYVLPILLPVVAVCSDFRIFTDKQGRQMLAKINQVSGDEILIERSDGLATKVSALIFSPEDQAFIREWTREQILKEGAIEARFSNKESEKVSTSNGGIRSTKYEVHYEVILKNTTDQEISDIHVEYLMLKFEDKVGAKKRSEGELERKKGKAHVQRILSRKEIRLSTENFPMLETELEAGYTWGGSEGGKSRDSEDRLEGIWVRVYVGDTLALEKARPQSLMQKEVW